MKLSTGLSLGAGALGLALCCGGGSCAGGGVGLGAGLGLGAVGAYGVDKVQEELAKPEDPCLDNLDPHPYIPNALHDGPAAVELKMCREHRQYVEGILLQ